MERLSMFIISIILASISVIVFGVYYSGISTGYAVNNTQNVTSYSQLTAVQNITEQLNTKIENQPTSPLGGFNIIGDFLSYGYYTYQLGTSSVDLFSNMLNNAFATLPLGSNNSALTAIKAGILATVIVMIVFLVIAFWSGRTSV